MKENGHDCLSGDFFYFFYFSKESVQNCSQLEHTVFVEVNCLRLYFGCQFGLGLEWDNFPSPNYWMSAPLAPNDNSPRQIACTCKHVNGP